MINLKKVSQVIMCLLIGACSTAPSTISSTTSTSRHEISEPTFHHERIVRGDVATPLNVWDPFEGINRATYRFNARFDKYVYLPALAGYQYITPDFVESGISNFFNNLDDIRTLFNQILQIKGKNSIQTGGRFVANSTLGIFGLFDVAGYFDMPKFNEDFGQTLGFYGVDPGPYLVLPIMGPSNLRDGIGTITDSFAVSPLLPDDHPDRKIIVYPLRFLDERAKTSFRYYQTGSPFEYELVRLFHSTKRNLDVLK